MKLIFARAGGAMQMAILLSAVAEAIVAPPAAGQTAQRSSIVGSISDPNGRVIRGAMVTLSGQRALGGARTEQTDDDGRYRFTGLLPGTYEVTAQAPGFRKTTRRGIVLPVETTYDVNLSLAVGGVSETVAVRGRAALIDARSTATPTIFDAAVLNDVPTGRTLQSVMALTPGIVTTSFHGVVGEVAYGGTQGGNAIAVDAVSLTEGFLGEQWSQVNYNWLDQVQVVAPGAPAEYGGFTGALANGVLRSGSNRGSGLGEWLNTRQNWRSDNLRHFPAGSEKPPPPQMILTWWDLNGQAGAPLIRDRLWLFAGANAFHHDYRPFDYAGPESTDERTSRAIAKVDAAASPALMLQGFVTRDATDRTGGRLSPDNPTPVGSPDESTRTHAWNARATWARSATTVVETRGSGNTGTSRQEPHPPATREGPSIVFDFSTGQCCNGPFARQDRSTAVVAADIGHYRRTRFGPHDLRGGIEIERTPSDVAVGIPAGRALFMDRGELVQVEEWAGDHVQTTGRRLSLFAQDRWRIGKRVTIEPGLRVEWYQGSVRDGGVVFSTRPIGPRLGVAWDVTGDQTTVARAHYGRYHDPQFGYLYSFGDPNTHTRHTFYAVTGGNLVPDYSYTEQVQARVGRSLKQPHVDQFVAGIERAIGPNTTAQVQYIGRRFGNFIGFIDERLADWTAYDVQDPGPDAVAGTADDGGTVVVYRPYGQDVDTSDRALALLNPRGAYRRYDGLQLLATRRFADSWQYQVSYTWSRSIGTVGNGYHTNAAYGSLSPGDSFGSNLNVSRAGAVRPIFDYSELKALGSYRAQWWGGFIVGGVFRWHDGTRWARRAFVRQPFPTRFLAEPAGSRRTPSIGALDMRVEKTVRLAQTVTAGVYVDVFNVTNVGRAVSYVELSGPNFGRAVGWTEPRTGRLGVRVAW